MRSDRSSAGWNVATQSSRPFAEPTLILRWVTTAVALAMAAAGRVETSAGSTTMWSSLILANTVARTVWPVAEERRRRTVELIVELAVVVTAAAATGAFESPFAFALIPPVAIVAFGSGLVVALLTAATAAAAVGAPTLLSADRPPAEVRLVVQWATELLLVAVVGSFAARILRDSAEEQRRTRGTVERLSDANDLLVTLHDITQELPATLDIDDALETVFDHVRSLVPVNYGGIALREDAGSDWRFVAHLGPVDPRPEVAGRLSRIRDQLSTCVLTAVEPGECLYPDMSDGRYVALRARGDLIGVLAVEHNTARLYDRRHDEALVLIAEAAALTIDNARLFGRLRHLGATEERARIARDLHDRMGQSLAYMGFELDRIGRAATGSLVEGDLGRLRKYLQVITGEVRETLYDLRSEVDDVQSAAVVLDEFAGRISARSGLRVSTQIDESIDLARVRERELCRITKEAMTNAERHSRGTQVVASWHKIADGVVAEIRDDGCGIATDVERDESYGIVGMRERAAAIGAELSIGSLETGGTVVRVNVPATVPREARRVPA